MTFQACDINEARHLYDQLAVLTPVIVSTHVHAPMLSLCLFDLCSLWTVS